MTHSIDPNQEEYPVPTSELPPTMKNYGRTRGEQIKINQKGIEILRKLRKEAERRTQTLSSEELQKELEQWKQIEATIDQYRSRKLFTKE